MKTATEQINNLITLTQHANQKHQTELSRKYTKELILLLKSIRDIIRTKYDPEKTTLQAKSELQKLISAKLRTGLDNIKSSLDKDMNDFMKVNNKLYTDQLTEVFSPVKDFLKIKKTKNDTIINGYNKDQMTFDKTGAHSVTSLWTTFTSRLNTIVKQSVNQAYILEEDLRDFESSIYGTTANTNVSKGNLDAVIGTFIAHGFSSVLKYTNKNNLGVFSGYIYIAIMDSVTTELCSSLNEKYYIYDAPEKSTLPYEIYPGVHYHCRSTISPITKTYQELGIDPQSLTEEQRQLLGKPDLHQFSYKEFFESQPSAIQKEILGKVRYDMWRSGEITIDKFFTRDGRRYTLAQLQQKGYEISEEYLRYVRK